MKDTKHNSSEKARDGYFRDLPENLQHELLKAHNMIIDKVNSLLEDPKYQMIKNSGQAMSSIDSFLMGPASKSDIGAARAYCKGKDEYSCMIQLTGHFRNYQNDPIEELLHDFIHTVYTGLKSTFKKEFKFDLDSEGADGNSFEGFDVYPAKEVAQEIWELFEDHKTKTVIECSQDLLNYKSIKGDTTSYKKESADEPEYNVEMSEINAKKAIRVVSKEIMDKMSNQSRGKSITQYTLNIYANVITKNLLPKWSTGYRSIKITLDASSAGNSFEFIPPTMTQDFVSRFVAGRESLNGFLHKTPEIRIRVSPSTFQTMKDPDDAFNFFKSAIQYYDSKIEKYGNKLMSEVMKLGHNMKHLIGNSKLSGLVTYPLSLLFIFDDVDMSSKNTFAIKDEDIQTINKFVRNIASRYAAPEKEKRQIVDDVKKMVTALKESCEYSQTISDIIKFPESLEKLYFGGFEDVILESSRVFIESNLDHEWTRKCSDPKLKLLQEQFGVKKLKKIPTDLVAYISIETEAIKDANDKMMIASYCLGKLEIVEWYIELLEVGSKRYVVPHTKAYLQGVRTQLLACFKKIMDTPLPKADRPLIDIQYPKGYEG